MPGLERPNLESLERLSFERPTLKNALFRISLVCIVGNAWSRKDWSRKDWSRKDWSRKAKFGKAGKA